MLQGPASYGKFGLEVEQLWDARESASLEARVLGEQVTYGPKII